MTRSEETRLAILETKLDALVKGVEEIKTQSAETSKTVSDLDKRVDGQRLFALGVMGAASTIAGFVGWGLGQLKNWVFG